MFLLISFVLLTAVFLFWLGYVPNTLYYQRRMYKKYYYKIMNTTDCGDMATYYHAFMKIVKDLNDSYNINIHDNYFFSYLYSKIHNQISEHCPDILECKPLPYDEVKCGKNELLEFQDYYYKNIFQNQHDNIEFHNIRKRNERYRYPCSIDVYTDFDTHGYLFDIDNVLRDGKCVREIVSHAENDEHNNQSVLE